MNTNNLWGWIPFLTGQTIYWVIVGVKYHSSKKCYNDISAIRYLCRPKFSFETLPSNPHEVPKKLHFKSIILMMYIECLKYVELCCIICRQHCFVIQEPGVLLSIIAYSLHEQLLNQFFVKNPSRVLPRIVMDKDLAKKHNYKKSMKNKGWNLSKCNTFSMIEHYLSVLIPSLWKTRCELSVIQSITYLTFSRPGPWWVQTQVDAKRRSKRQKKTYFE